MKVFFCGIGGIGMSALAQLCSQRGDTVCGSDKSENKMTQLLATKGIAIFLEQKSQNITPDIDVLVYTEAIAKDNPERTAADNLSIRQASYFEFLAEALQDKKIIAVTGTHGKTTTVGLGQNALKNAGLEVTTVIGSTLKDLNGTNFCAGNSDWAIVEACEYRENFRFLQPEIVILTNLEWDHPDYFKTETQYFEAMARFCNKAPMVVAHLHDPATKQFCDTYLNNQVLPAASTPLNLTIPGEHNRENARTLIPLTDILPVNKNDFIKGLESFQGADRRQEFLGISPIAGKNLMVFDDYGHHPTEIKATLEAFKEKFPQKKIALVYEAHQFSRTATFLTEFQEALKLPDFLGVFPIFKTRDAEHFVQSVGEKDLLKVQPQSVLVQSASDIIPLVQNLSENDILLFMGAGNISAWVKENVSLSV